MCSGRQTDRERERERGGGEREEKEESISDVPKNYPTSLNDDRRSRVEIVAPVRASKSPRSGEHIVNAYR